MDWCIRQFANHSTHRSQQELNANVLMLTADKSLVTADAMYFACH
jgi:hypothetical protein